MYVKISPSTCTSDIGMCCGILLNVLPWFCVGVFKLKINVMCKSFYSLTLKVGN